MQIFYKLTINFTKLSILFLYQRIFVDRKYFVRTCWVLVYIVLLACVSLTTATIMQCNPIQSAWHRWDMKSSCINIYALWYSNAIYNILTDFIIILVVPPVIFTLNISWRQKLALTCIFGLGIIVCAASISRLTTLYSSAYGNDPTAGSLVSTIWTTIEAGLGTICANLPMLRTPVQRVFPRMFPSRRSTFHIPSIATSGRCLSSKPDTLVSSNSTHSNLDSEAAPVSSKHMVVSRFDASHPPSTNLHEIPCWQPSLSSLPEHDDIELQDRRINGHRSNCPVVT